MPDASPSSTPAVPPGLRARNAATAALLVIGLFQMTGYLFGRAGLPGAQMLRGLGAVTTASPLPKVFSDVDGLETFASSFTLVYEVDGDEVRRPITPELYQRMRGPYWRRNVYGAALSYGPRMPREIWETVFCYGLAEDGPFPDEFDVPANATGTRIVIETNTRGRNDTWILQPECAQ